MEIALHFEFEKYLASIPEAIEKVVYMYVCVCLHMYMYVCVAVVHVMEHAS